MITGIFYGWWIVLACFLIALYVAGVVLFGFSAFFEPIVKEFGWSYAQVSFATSLRGLEMGIFAPIIGFLVDRFGSRKLVFFGTITAGSGLILLSFASSLVVFYASFLLLALGSGGCMSVVLVTAVAKWFDTNFGKAFGVVTCGFGAGGLMVPLIVWFIDLYHWTTALIILGLGMWMLGIPLSFVIRDRAKQFLYIPNGGSLDDPMTPIENKSKGFGMDLKEAIKQRTFVYLGVVEVIRFMIASAVILHVMPYLSTRGIPRPTAGIVAAAIPVFSIIGRFGFGWLGDVYSKKYTMVVALCLMGMGLLTFCYLRQGWIVLLFLFLFSSGCWGSMVLSRTIQREYFGKESFGRMLGVILGLGSLGGIIGPTLAGWVFDSFGAYRFVWLAFLFFTLMAIILVLRIEPQKNR